MDKVSSVKGIIAIAVASIMILFALSLDWYTIQLSHHNGNVIFELNNERDLNPSLLLRNEDIKLIRPPVIVIVYMTGELSPSLC